MSRQGLEGTTGRNNDNVAPHTHKHIQSFHLGESTGKTPSVLCHFLLLAAQKTKRKKKERRTQLTRWAETFPLEMKRRLNDPNSLGIVYLQ